MLLRFLFVVVVSFLCLYQFCIVELHLQTVIMPVLMETLKLKMERTVDLGPFKHKVDDNLPLRKVALTCIDTILDTCVRRINVPTLMQLLPTILVDKDDIRMQTHQVRIFFSLNIISCQTVLSC